MDFQELFFGVSILFIIYDEFKLNFSNKITYNIYKTAILWGANEIIPNWEGGKTESVCKIWKQQLFLNNFNANSIKKTKNMRLMCKYYY